MPVQAPELGRKTLQQKQRKMWPQQGRQELQQQESALEWNSSRP